MCRSLGLPGALEALVGGEKFGPGTGAIWLDNVTCSGREIFIQNCQHSGLGVYGQNCLHSRDVGVVCSGEFCARGSVVNFCSCQCPSCSCQ